MDESNLTINLIFKSKYSEERQSLNQVKIDLDLTQTSTIHSHLRMHYNPFVPDLIKVCEYCTPPHK